MGNSKAFQKRSSIEKDSQSPSIRVVTWDRPTPLSQPEAEAMLSREGYEAFCWYDVPESSYPVHQHEYDECLWILKGEIHFKIHEITYVLKDGDKIYLPAHTFHTSYVPTNTGVTYLVGQKRN